ncbi:urea amidolyase associated protein UAAP1 [Luteolibacter sp. AS25]|uniref:urea amidolyase associated protein UAAP1 n=1 Tax=Luteolibacter sp. AS25 TaxID=3135776 RepID=UPI00398B22C7
MNTSIYKIELSCAGMWSKVLGKGKVLKLTDLEGGANVGMMLYNAHERTERYNMPDTLKGQQVFFMEKGLCLHTDMGRLIASIIDDTVGWHDTVCGATDAAEVKAKYGELTYQDGKNDWYRSGFECFMIELAKWGMGEKDLMPNLNWFSKVVTDEEGGLSYVPGNSKAGDSVSLRMEMDTLVVLNTCQHPLDTEGEYLSKKVLLEVSEGEPVADGDACIISHPENGRAFQNTCDYQELSKGL